MVLGSVANGITYPKSLYYSAMGCGFGYLPNALMIEPAGWDDENNKWLASLYGLSYERAIPEKVVDPNEAWEAHINRIWRYLREGSAVQVCRGWVGAKEERGRIIARPGIRLFWWEGMRRETRPDMHYFTVAGLDKSKGIVYAHDPIGGWFGIGRNMEVKLKTFRMMIERAPRQHRYITIAFTRTTIPAKSEGEIERLLQGRIARKIEGDPAVYDGPEMWRSFYGIAKIARFEHGLRGLKALKNDLYSERFKKILNFKMKKSNRRPVEVVSWIDLNVYHYSFITSNSAEYLEKEGRIKEWEWLFNLHLLYEKLWVSTTKIRSVFKNIGDLDQAVTKSKPMLKDMRGTIDDMMHHFQYYLKELS